MGVKDKSIGQGLYLIGPVIERENDDPYFVMAFGSARTFTMDYMVVPANHNPRESRADMLRMAKNNAFGVGGAEEFDDQHALLLRAIEIWPNRKTRQALTEFEERTLNTEHEKHLTAMNGEKEDGPPVVLVEWQKATQAYVTAKETNQLTEEIRNRAREAWLAIKDKPGFEPSPFALELMAEIMSHLN